VSWPFDSVVVVFNPQSTGDAAARARDLITELTERAPDLTVDLRPTEHAGHARDIARDAARAGRPLVVSVSGDGGYNEVVDGVMKAGTGTAVAAVLAAGNANDHRRVTRERPLADAILAGDVRRIDLLRLTFDDGADVRYAHSYVGLGITPTVALELEEGGKGSLREVISTIRTFARFRPFAIETDHGRETFDSLILANIAEMAKYASLSDDGRPDDGRFEVVVLRHTAKWRVVGTALRAALRGLGPQPTAREYRFRTVGPIPMQIDGEVLELAAGTAVAVEIAPHALATVL
jgi:diacylglycerol kinase (ATP)